jgi:hypothetical protein
MLRPPAVGDTLLVAHMDEVNYECNYEVFYRGQVTRTTATRVTVRWLDYQVSGGAAAPGCVRSRHAAACRRAGAAGSCIPPPGRRR